MKKWLTGIKLAVLAILIIGFIAYVYINKFLNKDKDKEGFQAKTDNDFHFGHFDISANYYDYSYQEKNGSVPKNSDTQILNIGNILGSFDPNNIPWDSENLNMNPTDVLWGCVPQEASADLYYKVYTAQQIANIRLADDNKFYYNSVMLHYGTGDPFIAAFVQLGDFMGNFLAPLLLPIAAQNLQHAVGAEVHVSDESKQRFADLFGLKRDQPYVKPIPPELMPGTTERRELMKSKYKQFLRSAPDPNFKFNKDGKPNTSITKAFDFLKAFKSKTIMTGALKIVANMFVAIFDWMELIADLLTKTVIQFLYMAIIMPLIMAMAMPLVAPRSGSVAYVQNEIAGVAVSLVAMAVTAGAATVAAGVAEATGVDPLSKAAALALHTATLLAAVAGALAAFFEQRDAVPANYKSIMQGMMESTGHGAGDGKCPAGYVGLNEVFNSTLELFFSFVPVIGDLFDLMYPYLCIRQNFAQTSDRANNFMEQLVCIRDPYISPKYLDQAWISCKFLDWPDYNSKYSTGAAVSQAGANLYQPKTVGGKMRIVPNTTTEAGTIITDSLLTGTAGAIAGGVYGGLTMRTQPYYSWMNFTNFMDIANNPNNYFNLDVDLDGFNQKLTFQYIGGKSSKDTPDPDNTFRFFYLDFTEPSILVEMAQFYYNNAMNHPFPNDDGTVSISYISKINYVAASSLFTCDCMCELTNVTYNPITGEVVNETTSFDSDRRFYFRWTPGTITDVNGNKICKPLTPIWGQDKGNPTWVDLDNAWDEALYYLNDAIHFPTDPNANSTGLISGEQLLTAYELYNEVKERSDYASQYIYNQYTATSDLQQKYSSLVSAYTAYQTALDAYNSANNPITTGQYAGNIPMTTIQSNLIIARDAYDQQLGLADPFYIDLLANTINARTNYLNTLGRLYTNNENFMLFVKNDLDFNSNPIINDLQAKMDAVITARTNYYNQHLIDRPPTLYNYDLQCQIFNSSYQFDINSTTSQQQDYHNNKYFDVTGCTFIDQTANEARTPDPSQDETEIRFPVQFDVTPYLRRCPYVNITTDRCIDLSNVELVINTFKNQNPTKRIKTIHNIQGKGNNICQFIWDEYDTTTPTNIIRTTNPILYQMNLSSCSFCLPTDTNNNSILYANTNSVVTSIQPVPTVSPPTRYLGITTPANPNPPLQMFNASYLKPIGTHLTSPPDRFDFTTTNDTVPRYDITNYNQLPDLIRPKKPIRVIYPNDPETKLAGELSNYCGNPQNLSNFMLKYNQDTTKPNKILNIQRAYTTGPNTCDMEVDMLIPTPTKPDGSPYLTHSIIDITKLDNDITTIQIDDTTGFTSNMVVNIRFDKYNIGVLPKSIHFNLLSDAKNSDGDYTTAPHTENVSDYTIDSNVKGVFQAIQGNVTISEIDKTNKKITYINDKKRYPFSNIDFDPTTSLGGSDTYTGVASLSFTVSRTTISATLTSNGNMTEPFTNTPFTYNTLSSGPSQGLQINKHTSTLNGPYSNTGFQFNTPEKEHTNTIFGPNISYFNNNLVSNYTNTMSSLKDSSKKFLSDIYSQVYLSNNNTNPVTATTNPMKCDNPIVMQRIMDSYNNISTPTGLFNQEKNTMLQIVQASTDKDNNCHIIFENKNELFADYYAYNRYDSNNYTATNTLMFKSFKMNCDNPTIPSFNPVIYNTDVTKQFMYDINFNSTLQADDIALSLGTNLSPYYQNQRTSICQVDANFTSALFNTFKSDYQAKTNNTITTNIKYKNISYDTTDYLVAQTMVGSGVTQVTSNIIRVRYSLNPFNPATPTLCDWTYTPYTIRNNSFTVQWVVPNTFDRTKYPYPYIQYIDSLPVNFTAKDNVSPLFMEPEYTGSQPSDAFNRLS